MGRTKKKPGPECVWTRDASEWHDYWETECGHAHQFTDGGPVENEHAFCPYCGRALAARRIASKEQE